MSGEEWKAGMTRIAPGVYDDGRGGMHIDGVELLQANGYAATAENKKVLRATWRQYARDHGIPVCFVEWREK